MQRPNADRSCKDSPTFVRMDRRRETTPRDQRVQGVGCPNPSRDQGLQGVGCPNPSQAAWWPPRLSARVFSFVFLAAFFYSLVILRRLPSSNLPRREKWSWRAEEQQIHVQFFGIRQWHPCSTWTRSGGTLHPLSRTQSAPGLSFWSQGKLSTYSTRCLAGGLLRNECRSSGQ